MNLLLLLHRHLILLLSIWLLSPSLFFSVPIDPSLSPPLPSISTEPILPTQTQPFSPDPKPHPPGVAEARAEHHKVLNIKFVIALIVALTVLGGILLSLTCYWIYRRERLNNSDIKSQQSLEASSAPVLDKFNSLKIASKKDSITVFEYKLLVAATNNFEKDNVLGEGGSGLVYKAHFSQFLAAVKRLEDERPEAEREFENEVAWLTRIQHQNVISLLGYCIHEETRFVVYELMHKGSLESQLHGPSQGSELTWHLRMKIALDIARGLEYLHERCNPPVIHRDIKSSNILLDSTFNAKLSDFGLAIVDGIQNKNNIKLSGTLGYVAPEYLIDGKLTDKSDVYAFGVVLLELLLGRKAVDKTSSECQSIVTWAMPQLTDRSKLPKIVDPVIRDTMDLKHLYQVAAVAVLCIQPEPSYRPLITDVLHSFIPLVPVELGGSLKLANHAAPASA